MVSLHDMRDRGQCARRALHSVGYDVGTSNITMVMVILCVSIVNISTGVVRANVRQMVIFYHRVFIIVQPVLIIVCYLLGKHCCVFDMHCTSVDS